MKNLEFEKIKKGVIILCMLFTTILIKSQNVGISPPPGTPPDPSAGLDINFTDRGLLIPRMTTAQRNSIASPADALMIYNTTTQCFEAYNSSLAQWISFGCIGCPMPGSFAATAATGIGTNSFVANWTNSAGATNYFIDVSQDSNFSTFVTGYNNLSVGNVTSFSVTGLSCGTYYFRVRASNSCGTTANSNTVMVVLNNSCIALNSWQYKVPVTINNSGSALTNYQVLITLNTAGLVAAGKMLANGNDIRVTDSDKCTLLDFWIETGTMNTNATNIWVKVPSLPSGNKTIYIYYGNPSAPSASDGYNTFYFFDDFDSGVLNTSRWSNTGSYSLSGSNITITTGAIYSNNTVASQPNIISEAKVTWNNFADYSGLCIADVQATAGNNTNSNKVVYLMTNSSNSSNVTAWAANGTSASYNIVGNALQFTAVAGTTYIIGHAVTPTQVIFYNNRVLTNSYTGTWTSTFYLWLGYFRGSSSRTVNISDIVVDWVLCRQYASVIPTTTIGTEEPGCQ
jgi:hypothetical protein